MSTITLFREVQYFPRWLFQLPLVILLVIFGIAFVSGNLEGPAVAVFLGTFAFVGALSAWIGLMRLITEVDAEGVHVRLGFLLNRRIAAGQIETAFARTYRPLLEYGGWGVRLSWKGKAYNARGNRGVQLVLKGGERVLLGSQQPEELLAAIRQVAPDARAEGQ